MDSELASHGGGGGGGAAAEADVGDEQLERLFARLDVDGSGTIGRDELIGPLQATPRRMHARHCAPFGYDHASTHACTHVQRHGHVHVSTHVYTQSYTRDHRILVMAY